MHAKPSGVLVSMQTFTFSKAALKQSLSIVRNLGGPEKRSLEPEAWALFPLGKENAGYSIFCESVLVGQSIPSSRILSWEGYIAVARSGLLAISAVKRLTDRILVGRRLLQRQE